MEINWYTTDLTGVAASTALKIRRVADGYILDWDDMTFKASGWTTISANLSEIDSTNLPGFYNKVLNVASWNDGFYQAIVDYAGFSDSSGFYLKDGLESIEGVGVGSPGAIAWTYNVTDSVTGLPIADVDVWVSTDIAGTNVINSGRTDASGNVTFYLDAGSYYVWSQKTGYNFANPDVEVVS